MPPVDTVGKAYRVPFSFFIPFLLISFGLAWGILGLYIFLSEKMVSVFGQLTGNHPLFFLAVYAPAIAAFAKRRKKRKKTQKGDGFIIRTVRSE
jgi:hypothetical protein